MKPIFLCAVLACSLGLNGSEEASPFSFPPHTVPGTFVRELPRVRDDRVYQLHISVPPSFKPGSGAKYPVVLVTDAYYDFTTVVAAYGNSHYGKQLPEMIIVGLGYAGANVDYETLRLNDLSPVDLDQRIYGMKIAPGRAREFLQLIKNTVLPLLEKEYNADPKHRYLMGCSMGGLFTLYSMYTEPNLFQGYVADSPAVDALAPFEADFAASGKTIDGPVYIAACQNEWPGFKASIESFSKLLQSRPYLKGGFRYKEVADLRHAGGKPETYSHGLVFICQSIAPEHGVSKDWYHDPKGRPTFLLMFRPAPGSVLTTMPPDHEKFVDALVGNKDIITVERSTAQEERPFTIVSGYFESAEAAKRFAETDPSVANGSLVVTIR